MNNSDNGLGCFGTIIGTFLVLAFMAGNVALFKGSIEDSYDEFFVAVAIIGDAIIGIIIFALLCKYLPQKNEEKQNRKKEQYLCMIKSRMDEDMKIKKKIINTITSEINDTNSINKLLNLINGILMNKDEINALYNEKNIKKYDKIKEQVKNVCRDSEIESYPSTYQGIIEYKNLECGRILQIEQLYKELCGTTVQLSEVKKAYKLIVTNQLPFLFKNIDNKKEYEKSISKRFFCIILSCIAAAIPIVVYYLAVDNWKDSVETYVYQLVSDNITKYSSQDDSDYYESKLEKYYEITEINYYKLDNVIEIVPVLKLYANNRYVDKDEGSVVLRELCDSYYFYTNKIPEEICKFGGTHIVANGTIIEPDGSKVFVDRYANEVKYFIVPAESKKFIPYSYLIIPYIIYCVVLFLVCRKNIRSVDSK